MHHLKGKGCLPCSLPACISLLSSGGPGAAHLPTHGPLGVLWAWGEGGLFLKSALEHRACRTPELSSLAHAAVRRGEAAEKGGALLPQGLSDCHWAHPKIPSAGPTHPETDQIWGWYFGHLV